MKTGTLVYSVVRVIFRAAVTDRVLAISLCERITLPQAPLREVTPLPAAALAAAVPVPRRTLSA